MELLIKYQVVIVRTLGILMLVVGFITYFWGNPNKKLTQNELAAMNLARMEAKVSGTTSSGSKAKVDMSSISKHTSEGSKKQQQYMTILAMILGALFIGYSFLKKKE